MGGAKNKGIAEGMEGEWKMLRILEFETSIMLDPV